MATRAVVVTATPLQSHKSAERLPCCADIEPKTAGKAVSGARFLLAQRSRTCHSDTTTMVSVSEDRAIVMP